MMLKKYSQLKIFEGLRGPSPSPHWGEGGVRGTPHSAFPARRTSSLAGGRNPQSKGFTLIEVILIMAIIGILAATVVPRIDFTISTTASVDGAAYIVASDIRYAQEWAMANRVSKQVIFTQNLPTYTFFPTSNLDPSGQLQNVTISSPNYTLTFNSLGEPTSIVFPDLYVDVTVSGGGLSKTIRIRNFTGKVEIL
jgi:prepilin-type N-terminal cleavage/methylation domain-containing protein